MLECNQTAVIFEKYQIPTSKISFLIFKENHHVLQKITDSDHPLEKYQLIFEKHHAGGVEVAEKVILHC